MTENNAGARRAADQRTHAPAQERMRRLARRRRQWALWALLFPLVFTTVIAIGLLAMFYKRMEFFRPAHASPTTTGSVAPSKGNTC